MTPCDAFLETLSDDQVGPVERAHAEACPRCRPLLPDRPEEEADEGLGAIRSAARAEISRAPVRPWQRDALLLAGVNLLVVGVGVALLGTSNVRTTATPRVIFVGAALVLGLALSLGAALALAPGMRWPRRFLLLAAVVPLGVLATGDRIPSVQTFASSVPCAVVELLSSLLPLGVAAWLLTRTAPDLRRTLAVGLACGAVGLFALHLACTNGSWMHLLGFHLLPWAAVGALAFCLRGTLGTRSWAP